MIINYQVVNVKLNRQRCESDFLVTLLDGPAPGLVTGPVLPLTFGSTVPNNKATWVKSTKGKKFLLVLSPN